MLFLPFKSKVRKQEKKFFSSNKKNKNKVATLAALRHSYF